MFYFILFFFLNQGADTAPHKCFNILGKQRTQFLKTNTNVVPRIISSGENILLNYVDNEAGTQYWLKDGRKMTDVSLLL